MTHTIQATDPVGDKHIVRYQSGEEMHVLDALIEQSNAGGIDWLTSADLANQLGLQLGRELKQQKAGAA